MQPSSATNSYRAASTNNDSEYNLSKNLIHPLTESESSLLDIETSELKHEELCDMNEIPGPIQELDGILSEFDEADSLPMGISAHENHSEDDGYMSLNGKSQMQKTPPTSSSLHHSDHLANIVETSATDSDNVLEQPESIIQTLPKIRTTLNEKGKYSSLPTSSMRANSLDLENQVKSLSSKGRNILGIDISAVHNAVLRGGVVKLPEPILNEHPVTIYPGRQRNAHSDQTLTHKWSSKSHIHPEKEQSLISKKFYHDSKEFLTSSGKIYVLPSESNQNQKSPDTETEGNEDSEEFSQDSLDGQEYFLINNSTVSAPVTPYQLRGIAWEIKFKNNIQLNSDKKSKENMPEKSREPKKNLYASKIPLRKDRRPCYPLSTLQAEPSETEKFKIEDIFKGCSRKESTKGVKNFKDCKNESTYHDKDSMLGKGTFIIRKRSKDNKRGDILNSSINDNQLAAAIYKEEQCNKKLKEVSNNRVPQKLSRAHLSLDLEIEHNGTSLKSSKKSQGRTITPEISHLTRDKQLTLDFGSSPSLLNSLTNSVITCDNFEASVKHVNTLRSPDLNDKMSQCTTPHRELAPPLEEDEEQCSESQSGCGPLLQIEHNISALLRGDMAVARVLETSQSRILKTSLGCRPGVHKSESAKEMLLSQIAFGPLPLSPPSSSPELNDLPPLPPSPLGTDCADILDTELMPTYPTPLLKDKSWSNSKLSRYDLPLPPTPQENIPPAVPPHRGGCFYTQTIRSRSIDSNYTKKCPKTMTHGGQCNLNHQMHGYAGSSACDVTAHVSRRAIGSHGMKVRQSPREEQRLQTSCSLPETPIFARGCTPHRRPNDYTVGSGCRTAPRTGTSQAPNIGSSSIVGISGVGACRQRILAPGELLRLSGGPARGWYPKQRSNRPASVENVDRISSSHAVPLRVWDSTGGMCGTTHIRKPLTLPPNLTPSFLNQSPRDALRRVTSLLINKKDKGHSKERGNKKRKENILLTAIELNNGVDTIAKSSFQESSSKQCHNATQKPQRKKGFFKQFWKKSKHYSVDQ